MIPVRFGQGGPVIGQVTKVTVDGDEVSLEMDISPDGRKLLRLNSRLYFSFSFDPLEVVY